MIEIDRLFNAYVDELRVITILLPLSYYHGESNGFTLKSETREEVLTMIDKVYLADCVKYTCKISADIDLGQTYHIVDGHGGETDLQIGAVIRTQGFDEEYYYDGPLGILYSPERTIFLLWAPTATRCRLKLRQPNTEVPVLKEMTRGDRGVWVATVEGDLDGYEYTYCVCVNLIWNEAVDPYAVAVTANGEKGVIVDLHQTPTVIKPRTGFNSATDAIIYEVHVRDLTIHPNSGVEKKGLYQGAAEWGTTNSHGFPTALSYMKELGITHIELLPVNDFVGVDELGDKEDYNWGYNPLHYNVPEGSYATNPSDPYSRIIELKQLINAIHQSGMRVILDVVYNHVYKREDSPFEKIVPGYYFRHDENGMPSNGTGVGNDLASEHAMVRKFILDSVLFWKKEYGVDGFRFDLMGILDVTTMNAVRKALTMIDPSALLIGEGWDLNTPIQLEEKASIRNERKLPGIGQFNDYFRDSVKGNTFNLHDKGYVLGNERYYDAVKQILAGSIGLKEKGLFHEPVQAVNYIECHDNHTFWDKLSICEGEESVDIRKKQHRLATAIVLFAQGIPFLHAGQEFFRTKKGVGNSYRSPNDINQLDWDQAYAEMEHIDFVKGLISVRKSHQAFRFSRAEQIRQHASFLPVPKPVIAYYLDDVSRYGPWHALLVLINPLRTEVVVNIPNREWSVLVDEHRAQATPLRVIHGDTVVIPPLAVYCLGWENYS